METKQKIIYWLPRLLSLGFVIFLSLFALDVFGEKSGWAVALALVMHLLPSLGLLIVIIIAWKYELVGAIVFFAFAIFYILMVGSGRPFSWYAFISIPSAIVGILYFLSWRQNKSLLQGCKKTVI